MLDTPQAVAHLSEAIQIRTISYDEDEQRDAQAFLAFHQYLEKTYPLMHRFLKRETVDGYALLYRWERAQTQEMDVSDLQACLPILFLAHMDVVPVTDGTERDWSYAPFSGAIEEGYVWGRGAIDMKGHLIALCEACETLLEQGYVPPRDVYFAFGYDEEMMKESSAAKIVRLLESRGLRFLFVLDEGMILDGTSIHVTQEIAALGIAEKGYADIRLRVKGDGGHASTPPQHTALGRLAKAICAVEAHPMRARIAGPTRDLLRTIAPHMRGWNRLLYTYLWCTSAFVIRKFKNNPKSAALIRTTFAPTMAKGAQMSNVLPQQAEAVLNVRIAPWESVENVMEHLRSVVGSDVEMELLLCNQPTPVTDIASCAYRYVAKTVQACYPGMLVAPYPMVAATDSRYFVNLTDAIIRFVPFRSVAKDVSGMHGTNERLAIDSFIEGIDFFIALLQNLHVLS